MKILVLSTLTMAGIALVCGYAGTWLIEQLLGNSKIDDDEKI